MPSCEYRCIECRHEVTEIGTSDPPDPPRCPACSDPERFAAVHAFMRFLDSPEGRQYASGGEVEVWTCP
jgi:hypothetical protein